MAPRFRKLRIESLEQRTLLAADFVTAVDVDVLDVRDLAAIYAPQVASTSELAIEMGGLWESLRGNDKLVAKNVAATGFAIKDEAITVSIMGDGTSQELRTIAIAAGLTPSFVSDSIAVVDGTIALSDLHKLIMTDGVTAVLPARPSLMTDSVGSVANDAEVALRGEEIRDFLGLTGLGVSIGVISNGVGGLATSQGSNDLPPDFGTPNEDVTIRVLGAGTGNEGTAMLELIHDIAPGSNLIFQAAGVSEASFATAVDDLVAAGADIIVDDINGLFSESWFADGVAATSITNAIEAGVFVASSAGNRGDNAFESESRFVADQNVLGNVGTFQDFSGTGDFLQTVTITQNAGEFAPGQPLPDFQLQFDQPFGDVDSDVRLWLFSSTGTLITTTTQDNSLLNNPNDSLNNLTGTGTLQLAIELVDGPEPNRLRWTYWGDVSTIEHDVAGNNLRTGRNPGHAATIGNVSVGTTDVNNPLVRRSYSGIGEVTRTLTPAGVPLPNVEFRGGPTLMGVDGTQTTVPNFQPFIGTSAAAPNVAAIAALLLEADPSLDPAGLRSALTQGARDMDAAGVDLNSGFGLVDALGSIGIVQDTPQLVGLGDDEYIVVNDNRDLLDANTDPDIIDVDLGMAGEQISLRAAVINANTGGTETTLLIREDTYNLALSGTGGDTQGDLDITGNVTIVGAGAGLSVIDAAGLGDRVLEVRPNGVLDMSRVTITGGNLAAGNISGAGIFVDDDSSLTLTDSAVIGNTSAGAGGAISRFMDGSLTIKRSVFTDNQAGTYGGAIRSNGTMGALIIEGSVFANNTAGISGANVLLGSSTVMKNYGNNLIDDVTGDAGFFSTTLNDQIATAGSVDYVVTNVADRIDGADGGLSFREAVIAANAGPGTQVVWVPAWKHRLELAGSGENAAATGDLDITGNMSVVGAGAGLTVIDAGGSNGIGDRVFDIFGTGSLDLSRVTVTGGYLSSGSGAGFQVKDTGDLTVTDSAIVGNNAAAGSGGGVSRYTNGDATFLRTVFTGNNAGIRGGAIRSNGQTGWLKIGESVFANNTATIDGANVFLGGNKENLGNNLVDDTSGDFGLFSSSQGDYIGSVDYVVTSVVDTFNNTDNNVALSLREAIGLANANDNVAEEVWLPSWNFVLTRDRVTYGGGSLTDMDIAFGDLDISDSLTIRRAGTPLPTGTSAVEWRAGVTDATFDLLGDFTGDGINTPDDGDVDGGDFLAWQARSPSADGDDDGDVDSDDLDVWQAHFGNTLDLIGV